MLHKQSSPGPASRPEKSEIASLERFYNSNRTEFLKWAYKQYGLASDDAIDIYQDSVIILFENMQKGKLNDLQCTTKTYFYGIAKNLVFAYMKRRGRQMEYFDGFLNNGTAEAVVPSPDAEPDWVDTALEVMDKTLRSLNHKGQTIMYLFYHEKKTLRQIAQTLGYSNESVLKTTKNRYRKALQERMQAEMERQNAA
ncbi:MAG: sigma-70 family RNA polymerase sigma factor [Cytophagales bacterium]|nr:sigma-70 family RNA polymerase sigma factor [Cytophagales bacterium]